VLDGEVTAPGNEVRADIFAGGAGDLDRAGFVEAGPRARKEERGEAKPEGEKQAGEEPEEVRTGGGRAHGESLRREQSDADAAESKKSNSQNAGRRKVVV
jgi:hypothetical protein